MRQKVAQTWTHATGAQELRNVLNDCTFFFWFWFWFCVALKLSIGIIHKTEKRFFQPRSAPVHRTLLTSWSLALPLCLSPSFSRALYVRSWSATCLMMIMMILILLLLLYLGPYSTFCYVSTPNVNRMPPE